MEVCTAQVLSVQLAIEPDQSVASLPGELSPVRKFSTSSTREDLIGQRPSVSVVQN